MGTARACDRLRASGVGLRIVEQLNLSGVPAVVIDDDPDVRLARVLTSWGVPHISGSSGSRRPSPAPGWREPRRWSALRR